MFNFFKNSKKIHCLKKENLSPSLLGEKEAMKTADMISVHEFTFRTEKNPSFPPFISVSIQPKEVLQPSGQLCKDSPSCPSWGDGRHCKRGVTHRCRELSCWFRWLLQYRLVWGMLFGRGQCILRQVGHAGKHTLRGAALVLELQQLGFPSWAEAHFWSDPRRLSLTHPTSSAGGNRKTYLTP